jgi:hypothetical protein
VSILYRTHKSLGAAEKTNSLYVFDALCRAARSKANKKNLTGNINSEKGNCATFLLKIEGILEGLFQDMVTKGNAEAKVCYSTISRPWLFVDTRPSVARRQSLFRIGIASIALCTSLFKDIQLLTAVLMCHKPPFDLIHGMTRARVSGRQVMICSASPLILFCTTTTGPVHLITLLFGIGKVTENPGYLDKV